MKRLLFLLIFCGYLLNLPVPCTAGPPEEAYSRFNVYFEQDGHRIAPQNHVVELQKKPFAILVEFLGYQGLPVAIRLKPSASDEYFSQAANGALSTALLTPGIGLAEARNPEPRLFLTSGPSLHYLAHQNYGSRYHEVTIKDGRLLGKRNVEYISENDRLIRIEDWPKDALFLVFAKAQNDAFAQVEYYRLQFPATPPAAVGEKDPALAEAWLQKGKEHFKNVAFPEAIAAYSEAIALNPGLVKAYAGRGEVYFWLGMRGQTAAYDTAAADFSRAIELDPGNIEYYSRRANIYSNQRKLEEALADYSKIIQIKPDCPYYYQRALIYRQQGKLEQALADLSKAVLYYPSPSVAYHDRGTIYLRQNKLDEALQDFTKAIELEPKYSPAYTSRAIVYYAKGNLALASADCTVAIDLNPKAEPYYLRGVFYRVGKQHELAIEDLTKAISLNPKLDVAFLERGIAYREQGNNEMAIGDLTRAIELNARQATAFYQRGLAYEAQGNVTQALVDYSQSIEINPQSYFAYNSRGGVYLRKGQPELAVSDLNRSIAINPKYAKAYFNKGIVYKELGKKTEAIQSFRQFVELAQANDPNIEIAKREIKDLGL